MEGYADLYHQMIIQRRVTRPRMLQECVTRSVREEQTDNKQQGKHWIRTQNIKQIMNQAAAAGAEKVKPFSWSVKNCSSSGYMAESKNESVSVSVLLGEILLLH